LRNAGRSICLASLQLGPDPRDELARIRIRTGFPVDRSESIGGGKTDSGGLRFTQFRCKIIVDDYNWLTDRVSTVSGRIVVYVTGQRTFRWAVIP
jgi:hypothetical protein